MTALPAEKTDPREDAPYLACKHFLFEKGSFHEGGVAAPEGAGLCRSPIGPIDALDCPLWLGRTCRFFEERTEEPVALDEETLTEARDELREQYLRWRYRERVRRLAADGVDPELIDVTQLDPAEDARREAERRRRNEAKAKEQGKKKRRRRRRKKKSPAAAEGEGAKPPATDAKDANGANDASAPQPDAADGEAAKPVEVAEPRVEPAPESPAPTKPESAPDPDPPSPAKPEPSGDAPPAPPGE